jgi:PAS domain S-box-containing protein
MSLHQMTDAAQTILIIDDNPVNLRVLSDHLRQRGFRVVAAQDGEEGLERARIVKPDLILLDIMMPGINGLETCRRLKASDATREIPVIFKTSLADTATKIAGFEAGGVDYVTSPIQIEEVMARVQTHLTLHVVKKRLEQARDELEDRVQQRTAELHRLNRELRALSDCNQTLLRATDEQSLINDICRIICDEAGYRMAWVGYAEQDAVKTVRPVAWAGVEENYLRTAGISWSEESERGRGPTGTAIRSGTTCYNQDFSLGQSPVWRERVLQHGYRSGIALPLKDERAGTFGALTIYSGEPNAFTAEEIRILEELAHDLAFGITTIRTRAERQRAEQEVSLLRFALDNVREAAFLVGEDARFRYVNEEACRLLGYTREELMGMGVLDIVPEEQWSQHWSDLKAQRSLSFERQLRTKDGREIPAEVSANYFEYGGHAYNLARARDISERRQAEQEEAKLRQHLHQAQKMEAIGQLAGGVAHDFNNILGIINGYSEILLSERDLKESQRASLGEILAAGQRAASLTRQLLAFSRKLVLQPKVLNLSSVIEGFEKMLRRLIGDEIEIRTVLAPNLIPVSADPNQIEQVLLNFCINARDAMPEGGRITIETANLELDDAMAAQQFSLTPGRYVTVSVSDTGIGMDHETQSHIFEPFFTTKGPEHGTGLGLATVYGIIQQSGGHVMVDSVPGQGATFRVYLPAVNQETKEREQSSRPQELLRGSETILLVEDAAPLRTLYQKILEDRGYTVLEAGDGERAIQVAEQYQGNLALLLTDVSLPKMKGPALASILLQQRPSMKVMFMSGHSDEIVSSPDHLLPAGAGFIQKPFAVEDLFRRMREMLDSHERETAA